jgi:hypothetical protein
VFASPACAQVRPPSVERHTPLPHPCERSEFFSPVPSHTTFVSLGATATSPTERAPVESLTGRQVTPRLTVFQTPPPAVPTYTVPRYGRGTASEVTRPPKSAGPRWRAGIPASRRSTGSARRGARARALSAARVVSPRVGERRTVSAGSGRLGGVWAASGRAAAGRRDEQDEGEGSAAYGRAF